MKKELVFAFAAFFFMISTAITGANAGEKGNKILLVSEDKVDVTGDGKKDTVYIKGIPYEEGTEFLKEIHLDIAASNGKSYKVEVEGGYSPKVQYVDLNNDGVRDMFISVNTGGSGGISNHYLYTLKDFMLKDLTVPDPLIINSQFHNGYKASITIQNTSQSYTFDLRSRAEEYERMGLYQNGKLNEPTELMVDHYSTLKPVLIKGEQFGLTGVQAVSGAFHADTIAFVESTWFYENGKWTLKTTKVLEVNHQSRKNSK